MRHRWSTLSRSALTSAPSSVTPRAARCRAAAAISFSMTEPVPAKSDVRSLGRRALVEWGVLVVLAALLTLGAVRWSVVARLDAALYDTVITLHGHAPRDDIV